MSEENSMPCNTELAKREYKPRENHANRSTQCDGSGEANPAKKKRVQRSRERGLGYGPTIEMLGALANTELFFTEDRRFYVLKRSKAEFAYYFGISPQALAGRLKRLEKHEILVSHAPIILDQQKITDDETETDRENLYTQETEFEKRRPYAKVTASSLKTATLLTAARNSPRVRENNSLFERYLKEKEAKKAAKEATKTQRARENHGRKTSTSSNSVSVSQNSTPQNTVSTVTQTQSTATSTWKSDIAAKIKKYVDKPHDSVTPTTSGSGSTDSKKTSSNRSVSSNALNCDSSNFNTSFQQFLVDLKSTPQSTQHFAIELLSQSTKRIENLQKQLEDSQSELELYKKANSSVADVKALEDVDDTSFASFNQFHEFSNQYNDLCTNWCKTLNKLLTTFDSQKLSTFDIELMIDLIKLINQSLTSLSPGSLGTARALSGTARDQTFTKVDNFCQTFTKKASTFDNPETASQLSTKQAKLSTQSSTGISEGRSDAKSQSNDPVDQLIQAMKTVHFDANYSENYSDQPIKAENVNYVCSDAVQTQEEQPKEEQSASSEYKEDTSGEPAKRPQLRDFQGATLDMDPTEFPILLEKWRKSWKDRSESFPQVSAATLRPLAKLYPRTWWLQAMQLIAVDIRRGNKIINPGGLLYRSAQYGWLKYFPDTPPIKCDNCDEDGICAPNATKCLSCIDKSTIEKKEKEKSEQLQRIEAARESAWREQEKKRQRDAEADAKAEHWRRHYKFSSARLPYDLEQPRWVNENAMIVEAPFGRFIGYKHDGVNFVALPGKILKEHNLTLAGAMTRRLSESLRRNTLLCGMGELAKHRFLVSGNYVPEVLPFLTAVSVRAGKGIKTDMAEEDLREIILEGEQILIDKAAKGPLPGMIGPRQEEQIRAFQEAERKRLENPDYEPWDEEEQPENPDKVAENPDKTDTCS